MALNSYFVCWCAYDGHSYAEGPWPTMQAHTRRKELRLYGIEPSLEREVPAGHREVIE